MLAVPSQAIHLLETAACLKTRAATGIEVSHSIPVVISAQSALLLKVRIQRNSARKNARNACQKKARLAHELSLTSSPTMTRPLMDLEMATWSEVSITFK